MEKQQIDSINLLKVISILLIITLHSSMLLTSFERAVIYPLTRIGVPIFFMISGFFFFDEDKIRQRKHIKKACRKLILIFACLFLVYALYKFSTRGIAMFNDISLKSIIHLIFVNTVFWGGHLWYLLAYIYVLVTLFYFPKIFNGFIASLLLLANLLLCRYGFLLNVYDSNEIARNWLFTGIPFFTIGMIIKEKKKN